MHHSIWIWMRMTDFDPCMWGSVVKLLKVGQNNGLATADAGAWQWSRHRHTWMRPVRHAWRKQCSISNVSQLKSVVVQLSSNLICPSNFKLQSKISLIDLFKCRSLRYAVHIHSNSFQFHSVLCRCSLASKLCSQLLDPTSQLCRASTMTWISFKTVTCQHWKWTGLDYFLWVILQAASTIYYVCVLLGLLTETMVVWALWWAASFWRRLRLGLIDTWVSLRDTNHMSDDVFQWTNHVGSLAEWLAFQEWPLGTVLIRGTFPEETIGATNEWPHWARAVWKKCKCPPAGMVIHL